MKPEECKGLVKVSLFPDVQPTNSYLQGANDDVQPIKNSKVNKKDNTVFQSPELESAFQMYLLVREHNYGSILPEQVQALREDLLNLSNKTEEQIAIVKKATAGGYKEFRGMKKGKRTSTVKKKDNFNNFDSRSYDQEMYMGLIEK